MDKQEILRLEERFQESRAIESQIEFIDQQITELRTFGKSIEDLNDSENKEVLATIGKGIFLKTKISDRGLFVDVGGGIIIKKTPEETLKVVEEQLQRLGEMNFQFNSKLEEISHEMNKFIDEIGKQKK